ncbi:MAG: hypothetical protein SOZ00_07270 [Tidjanibacter sp.]|nr:hypothetical protein [Tidjanibacter sp.]
MAKVIDCSDRSAKTNTIKVDNVIKVINDWPDGQWPFSKIIENKYLAMHSIKNNMYICSANIIQNEGI